MQGIKKLTLTKQSQEKLINSFPPKFLVACSHVTMEFGKFTDLDITHIERISVIGYQSTSYLEVLVVSVEGTSVRNNDKSILHITHSLKPNVAPVCSNYVLNELLYHKINPLELNVVPTIILFSN